jgi:D-3-phosphoglycerate dehydrogenase
MNGDTGLAGGTPRRRIVVYLEYLAHNSFAETLAPRADVQLVRITNDMPHYAADAVLSTAHAYQIPATRDSVAPRYRADRALFARAPNLLIVSSSGAGYDTVDVDDCTRAGVLAVNQAGGNREAVAEHALGMMICLSKRMMPGERALRRGAVDERTAFLGNDIFGKTLGIVGLGQVGTRLAELCRGLFAMRVLAFDPLLSAAEIAARGAEPAELDDLLAAADFVSLHCPLTERTAGMIGTAQFALMRPGAYLVTTARGGIHDEAALAAALRSGAIAGAGLDVWAREPPPPDHPLLAFDNVIATPHIAGVTHEARRTLGQMAAQQILDVFDGKPAGRVLNPAVADAFAQRMAGVLSR